MQLKNNDFCCVIIIVLLRCFKQFLLHLIIETSSNILHFNGSIHYEIKIKNVEIYYECNFCHQRICLVFYLLNTIT